MDLSEYKIEQKKLEKRIADLRDIKEKCGWTQKQADEHCMAYWILEAGFPDSKYIKKKKQPPSVTLEDLPEDIIRSIAYRAKNGNRSILLYDKKEIAKKRENALEEIRRYKEAKKIYQSAENEKNEFKALADKLGIDLTKY